MRINFFCRPYNVTTPPTPFKKIIINKGEVFFFSFTEKMITDIKNFLFLNLDNRSKKFPDTFDSCLLETNLL